ncbi:MAG: T9SS type A sorting domain-containing protein [candidate division WOR-3 bacterium]|nr:MAG: T9SS type A sorting domain-containing protein [candidate division WOR-3 bacterium]
MKSIETALFERFVSTVCFLITTGTALMYAQWEPDVRLTSDPNSSYLSHNNAKCVGADNDFVHVLWFDNRTGNDEIFYKRSVDMGVTWYPEISITDDFGLSWDPSLAVYDSMVHVVWADNREGSFQLYYARSTNAGRIWGSDTNPTNGSTAGYPSVSVSGQIVHLFWGGICYQRSTDNGVTWQSDTLLCTGFSPSSATSGSYVHLVLPSVYYKRSVDQGIVWESNVYLTTGISPTIAAANPYVHVVYVKDDEIYYKRSINNGISWEPEMQLTTEAVSPAEPSIDASGAYIHIVWADDRDSNYEIYYLRSTDDGSTWDADTGLTCDAAYSYYPFVAASGTCVHVIWQDQRDGNREIYYKRNPMGNTGITECIGAATNAVQLTAMPNPFSKLTTVSFGIEHSAELIRLSIYDASGRLVKYFSIPTSYISNSASVVWDGRDEYDRQLVDGVYFVKLEAGDFSATEKILLVR